MYIEKLFMCIICTYMYIYVDHRIIKMGEGAYMKMGTCMCTRENTIYTSNTLTTILKYMYMYIYIHVHVGFWQDHTLLYICSNCWVFVSA